MNNDRIDASKIFIWGQIGQSLKDMDEQRILAIAQKNYGYHLGILSNREILLLIDEMKSGIEYQELKDKFTAINITDNIFREIAKFLHHEPRDLLSIGSFVTGEVESKTALLDLGGNI